MKNYKSWVVLFDESEKYHCGSEWARAFNLMPRNAEKRIMNPQYHKPKTAIGFVVLSDYEFTNMSYEEIETRYKMHGVRF